MSKKENRELIKQLVENLERLVSGMDVPIYKRRNVSWLHKNLSERNSGHKNFEEAMNLAQELINHGVSNG